MHQLLSGTDTQANRKEFNRFGSAVGGHQRHSAFDAGLDPDNTAGFQVTLVGNANQRQGEAAEGMTGIDNRHGLLWC
jgi:hypothetical protein